MSYKIKLDIFEGPLDLLLYLIKKEDLDICTVSIAEVTDQYLEYIEMMKTLDLDVVGDFLVMAATLMYIKSKMLLPPDPITEEPVQEDPADELVKRLLEYKRFKEIAEQLKNRESVRQDLFSRIVDEQKLNDIREDAKEVMIEASLFDLINALNKALKNIPEKSVYEVVKEEWTVEAKIHDILHLLVEQPTINLMDLFVRSHSRLEIIVTFMAVLELIRLKEIRVQQKRHFDAIEVSRNMEKLNTPQPPVSEEASHGGSEAPGPQPGN